jgi:hypothetical protein
MFLPVPVGANHEAAEVNRLAASRHPDVANDAGSFDVAKLKRLPRSDVHRRGAFSPDAKIARSFPARSFFTQAVLIGDGPGLDRRVKKIRLVDYLGYINLSLNR